MLFITNPAYRNYDLIKCLASEEKSLEKKNIVMFHNGQDQGSPKTFILLLAAFPQITA